MILPARASVQVDCNSLATTLRGILGKCRLGRSDSSPIVAPPSSGLNYYAECSGSAASRRKPVRNNKVTPWMPGSAWARTTRGSPMPGTKPGYLADRGFRRNILPELAHIIAVPVSGGPFPAQHMNRKKKPWDKYSVLPSPGPQSSAALQIHGKFGLILALVPEPSRTSTQTPTLHNLAGV